MMKENKKLSRRFFHRRRHLFSEAVFKNLKLLSLCLLFFPGFILGNDRLQQAEALILKNPVAAKQQMKAMYLEAASSEEKIQVFSSLAALFLHQGNTDSVKFYLQKAEALFSKKSDLKLRGRLDELWADYQHSQRDFQKSKAAVTAAISAFETLADSIGLARAFRLYSDILYSAGDDKGGLDYLQQAAAIAEAAKDRHLQARIYNDLGTELCAKGQHREAIESYQKAIELNRQLENLTALTSNTLNLGVSHFRLENPDSALIWYQKAFLLADSLKLYRNQAQILLNSGNAYKKMNNFIASREAYLKARDISAENGLYIGILYTAIALMNLENLQGNYTEAERFGLEALSLLADKELPYEKMKLYSNLRRTYEFNGDLQQAIHYYKLHEALFDSLNRAERNRQALEFKEKYEAHRKEKEILQLRKAQNEATYRQRIILISSGSFLALAAALIFIISQRNRIIRQELKAAEAVMQYANVKLEGQEAQLLEKSQHISQLNGIIYNLKRQAIKIQNENNDSSRDLALKQLLEMLSRQEKAFNLLEFEEHFQKIHPEFLDKLKQSNFSLSPAELQLAMLIRVGLSSKESAYLLKKSIRSVEDVRLRLRRKLQLSSGESLGSFFKTLA
jgi:tetratricopeptide (TPR) repeat protein